MKVREQLNKIKPGKCPLGIATKRSLVTLEMVVRWHGMGRWQIEVSLRSERR